MNKKYIFIIISIIFYINNMRAVNIKFITYQDKKQIMELIKVIIVNDYKEVLEKSNCYFILDTLHQLNPLFKINYNKEFEQILDKQIGQKLLDSFYAKNSSVIYDSVKKICNGKIYAVKSIDSIYKTNSFFIEYSLPQLSKKRDYLFFYLGVLTQKGGSGYIYLLQKSSLGYKIRSKRKLWVN